MNLNLPRWDRGRLPGGYLRQNDDDVRFAAGRIVIFQYIAVAAFLFLLFGFWELQVLNPQIYSERAERNRIRSLPIPAPRGRILDRDGRVIVDNHSSFSLLLPRENLQTARLQEVSEGLDLDYEELNARLRRFAARPRYQPMMLKERLTPGELAFVEAHRGDPSFPEMELIPVQRRLYPRESLAAHLLGYVGEVSERELNTAEFARYNPGDVVGKSGIERQYNTLLTGRDGQRQVVVDNLGVERRLIGFKDATPGRTIRLTIDLDLQAVAELAMQGRRGAVVALDPRTGEVLAMVSQPSFDPAQFLGGIPHGVWRELNASPDNPLINRVIQGEYAPGSTFKPIVALAGLETGVSDGTDTEYCAGGASFYGRFFRCHLKGGHGVVNLHKAIVQSCDVYFYQLGSRLGIDRIAEYAEMCGLGKKTGIDLPNEREGLVPSTRWKIRATREKWYAGETISVAIGQGALTVTPLQLAHSIGGLIMGGVWRTPHVLAAPEPAVETRRANLNPEHVAAVVSGMCGVVNEDGTGTRARLPGLVEVCGKTGTAQLASNEVLKGTKLGEQLKDNAWFVGFAPRESPEIVVVTLVEGGLHGSTAAAPVARDVIRAYFEKKTKGSPLPLMAREGAARSGPAQEP